jgi:predicted PurR-regulated permease PerM
MFKLLMSVLILGLVIIVGYVIFQLVKEMLPSAPTPKSNTDISIDEVIEELEWKIMRAELQAEKGIKSAEETSSYLKIELEKARNLKNKISK